MLLTAHEVAAAYAVDGDSTLTPLGKRPPKSTTIFRFDAEETSWIVRFRGVTLTPAGATPDPGLQRQTAFVAHAARYGLPAPKPVASVLAWGFGSALMSPLDDAARPPWHPVARKIFTAHALAKVHSPDASDRDEVRSVLRQVAEVAACLRVSAKGIGPWETYPVNTADHWRMRADLADDLGIGHGWSRALAEAAPKLQALAHSLPLDANGRHLVIADLVPGKVGLAADGRIQVTSWNSLALGGSTANLRHEDSGSTWKAWAQWGAAGGTISADDAVRLMRSAEVKALREGGATIPVRPRRDAAHVQNLLARLHTETARAVFSPPQSRPPIEAIREVLSEIYTHAHQAQVARHHALQGAAAPRAPRSSGRAATPRHR